MPPSRVVRPSSLLAVAPYPKPGEHPGSYVRRLAAENGYSTIRDLLNRLGVGSESDRFVGSTWQIIADATGIERVRLDPLDLELRATDMSPMVDFGGTSVPDGFIDRRFLRSCPHCLAEDGFLPKRFAIRHVTACTRHSMTLSDECACGRKRLALDRTFLWRCPACGLNGTEMPVEAASPNQMLTAHLMEAPPQEGNVGGVPDALLLLTVSDRIAVVERLGTVVLAARDDEPVTMVGGLVRTPVRGVPRSRRLHDDRAIVEAAMPLLLGWPASYRTLLNDLLDRNPNGGGRSLLLSRFGTVAGRLALRKVIGAEGLAVDFVEREKLAVLRDVIGYEPYWKTTPRPNKGFATAEVNRIADRAERLVNGREFQRRLGYGKAETIAAWSRAGLIKTTIHPNGAAQLSRNDLDGLLAWFTALPVIDPDNGDYVTFMSEVSRYSRGFYDREQLLRDVFAKALRIGRLQDGSEGLRSLVLHRADLARRRNLSKLIHWLATDAFIKSTILLSVAAPIWQIAPATLRQVLDECRDALGRRDYPAGRWSYPLFSVRDYIRELQRRTGSFMVRDDPASLEAAEEEWRSVVVEDSL